jgi:hypothetical protein
VYSLPDILSKEFTDDELLSRGISIGKAIVELGVNPLEVIELIGVSNQLIVIQGDNIIILPQHEEYKRKLSILLKGVAKGAGFNTVDSGEVTVILSSRKTF